MFHIYNSTVCLSFWWLPHIRLINNAWCFFSLFFPRFKHTYIYTQAHSFQKEYNDVFCLFCIVPDMHQSIWGFTFSEMWTIIIKSRVHCTCLKSWRQIWLLNILSIGFTGKQKSSFFYSFSLSTWKRIPQKSKKPDEHIFGPYALTLCISSTRPDQ